jgi:hypothetical protein
MFHVSRKPEMACGASLTSMRISRKPNKITAHNAGWRIQFRFAGHVFWPGVCEFVGPNDCYAHFWLRFAHLGFDRHTALSCGRCSEPGDGAPVDKRGSVAPGH